MQEIIDQNSFEKLAGKYRKELLEDCVPFWLEHSLDREYGGYITHLKRDGSPYGTAKLVWTQGRASYMFAKLYNTVEKQEEWLEASKHGLDFVNEHAFAPDSRAYYKVMRDGTPLYSRPHQIFAESFAVLAYAEYAKAADREEYLASAKRLFREIVERVQNGSLESESSGVAYNPYQAHATPMILTNTAQELREVEPDPRYDELIANWVHDELYLYAKDEHKAMFERIRKDGTVDTELPEGRQITPGHALESAWFCLHEGLYKNDRAIIDRSCEIMKWAMEKGWDDVYGGLYNYIDLFECAACHHDEDWGEDQDWDEKIFWIHVEGLYALLAGYVATGDNELLEWYRKLHYWTFKHFPDPEYGEWFGYLRRDGSVSHTHKGGMKGFFHLPRALLNCMLLLEKGIEQ